MLKKIIFFLTFFILFSCQNKNNLTHNFYYIERKPYNDTILVLLNEYQDSIYGYMYRHFIRNDIHRLHGNRENDTIFVWESEYTNPKYYRYSIFKDKDTLKAFRYLGNITDRYDTMVLVPISEEKFDMFMAQKQIIPIPLPDKHLDTIYDNFKINIFITERNNLDEGGKVEIHIRDKETDTLIQTLKNDSIYINNNFLFSLEDYSFDGYPDMRFESKNRGSYGTMKTEDYIYSPIQKKFIYHKKLNQLNNYSVYIGLDSIKPRVISYQVSGYSWHLSEEYEYKGDSLVLVKSLEENSDSFSQSTIYTLIYHENGKKQQKIFQINEKKMDSLQIKRKIEEIYNLYQHY
ncbi:MAG: hypothetical protein Q3983_09605 [Capnocytophaga sp.]|nr:hypothetical protein [Capnocytophaga sp.]